MDNFFKLLKETIDENKYVLEHESYRLDGDTFLMAKGYQKALEDMFEDYKDEIQHKNEDLLLSYSLN